MLQVKSLVDRHPMNISLYIHVPFCIKKCNYCDFYSVPYSEPLADEFVSALSEEWRIASENAGLREATVTTVFFGGGTPSILNVSQWRTLAESLIGRLNLASDAEWTIECNPDSFTEEKAGLWLSMGVTRLTFGIQSFNNGELRNLGRPHSAQQALAALASPTVARFKSVGLDLMYGLPHQTLESFRATLFTAVSAPVIRHLSTYELTICKNTPFGRRHKLPLPDEDAVVGMARLLFRTCRENGFERYEISNFARSGHKCSHNEAYWNHSFYIGLGPAAHSYVHPNRWANTSDVGRYVSRLAAGSSPIDFKETIGGEQLASEMILLRLRTTEGLDENRFAQATGREFYAGKRRQVLDDVRKRRLIEYRKPGWALTEDGMLVADAIIRDLV